MSFVRAVLVLALCLACVAADVWVREGAAGTGTQANPVGTLAQAFTLIQGQPTNSTIWVYEGSYICNELYFGTMSINVIAVSGPGKTFLVPVFGTTLAFGVNTASNNILIQGFSFSQFIGSVITMTSGPSVTIRNCVFTNNTGQSQQGSCIKADNVAYLLVEDCRFSYNPSVNQAVAAALLPSASGTVTFRRCTFNDNAGTALYVSNYRALVITECNFMNNTYAINNVAAAPNITLTNNRFYKGTTSTASMLLCPAGTNMTTAGNVFCGFNANTNLFASCPPFGSIVPELTYYDACRVCQGDHVFRDCNGKCFGFATNCTHNQIWATSTPGSSPSGNATAPYGLYQAIAAAQSGDTVILTEGSYTLSPLQAIRFDGRIITIKSQYGEFERTTINCLPGDYGFTFFTGDYYDTKIEGITINGCEVGVLVSSGSVTLKNVRFTRCGGGSGSSTALSVVGEGFAQVTGCEFSLNTATTVNNGGAITVSTSAGTTSVVRVSNTRFFDNRAAFGAGSGAGGAINVAQDCRVDIEASYFSNNTAGSAGASIYVQSTSDRLILKNTTFHVLNGIRPSIQCQPSITNVSHTQIQFCGNTTSVVNCAGWTTPDAIAVVDDCRVCRGNNATKDCSGTCFGQKVTDRFNTCCFKWQLDCNNVCNGTFKIDRNNTCCNATSIDCDNICFGGKEFDLTPMNTGGPLCCLRKDMDCSTQCFGTRKNDSTPFAFGGPKCCYKNQTDCLDWCSGGHEFDLTPVTPKCCFPLEQDCAHICFGGHLNDSTPFALGGPFCCYSNQTDCLNWCNGTHKNDSTPSLFGGPKCCYQNETDCKDWCDGPHVIDDNLSNPQCCEETELDCKRWCNGTHQPDMTPVSMGGPQCCFPGEQDCAHFCNGTHVEDVSPAPVCCDERFLDCAGVCNGTHDFDNSMPARCCAPEFLDCNGTCNGTHVIDATNTTCCLSSLVDCDGFCFGATKYDSSVPSVCCNRTELDCADICRGAHVVDNSSAQACCLPTQLDCGEFCDNSHVTDSAGLCCLATLLDACNVCNGNNACNPVSEDPIKSDSGLSDTQLIAIIASVAGTVALLLIIAIIVLVAKRRNHNSRHSTDNSVELTKAPAQ